MSDQRAPDPIKARRMAERGLELVRAALAEVESGHPADKFVSEYFRHHRHLGSRDRRFLGDLVFSYFRWRGWCRDAPIAAACAVSWFLDAVEAHPAGLALGEFAGITGLRPVAHLPLAEKAVLVAQWLARASTPSVLELVPEWVPGALAVDVQDFTASIQARPPTWLRARPGQLETVLALLREAGILAEAFGPLPNALTVPGSSPLLNLPRDVRARFEIQDLSSQVVGWVCAPTPGERWWDVCAGAGGKALHLADLLDGRGLVVATDIRSRALARLARRAERAGTRTMIEIATSAEANKNSFDGVLVDAPCSGLGTWSRNPDARWRTPATEPQKRAEQQLSLMTMAAPSVRPGGRLVYSVCTVTRAETTDVVQRFLNAHPNFELSPPPPPPVGEELDGAIWVLPQHGPCSGMYIARLIRRR